MCKKLIILSILLFCSWPNAWAQEETSSKVELHNLRWDWEVYDEEAKHYVPFFKNPNTNLIRFELNFNKYKGSELKLQLAKGYFIWIENELVYHSANEGLVFLNLDSLQSVYDKAKVYMKIYSLRFSEQKISTVIVDREKRNYATSKYQFIETRINRNRTDLFIVISIITLSLIALFRSFNYRLFQEYFSLSRSLQLRQNFDLIAAHSPMAWPNIGFILFYAILVGNAIMNIGLFQNDIYIGFPTETFSDNGVVVGLKAIGYCFVFMLLKLLLISVSSELFKIRKARLLHFFTYFRLSLIIAIMVFSFSMLYGIFEGYLTANGWSLIQGMVGLAWFGRLILIFFVLNKIYTFRKLHLFSYLCSTELIPLLLFLKIVT